MATGHETWNVSYDFSFPFDINVSRSESISMKQALLECFPCEMINYELETIMIAISFLNAVSTAMNTGLSHRGLYVGLSLLSFSWPRWLTSLEWATLHNRKQQLSACLCASQLSLSMWGSHSGGGGCLFAWVALLINIYGFVLYKLMRMNSGTEVKYD